MSNTMITISTQEYRQGIEAEARLQVLRDIFARKPYPDWALLMVAVGMPLEEVKEVMPCDTSAIHADAT